jgi:hypothetical protein
MLAMGLKVIVAGRHYAGPITNENFQEHWDSNCNSDVLRKTEDCLQEDLKKAEVIIDVAQFDMRNQVHNYLEILRSL